MTTVKDVMAAQSRVILGQGQPGDKELLAEVGDVVLPVSSTQPPRQVSKTLSGYEDDPRHDPEFLSLYTAGKWDEANAKLTELTAAYAERVRERAARGGGTGLMPNPNLPQPASVPLDDDLRAKPYTRPPSQTSIARQSWEELQAADPSPDQHPDVDLRVAIARGQIQPPMRPTAPVAPPQAARPPSVADLGVSNRRGR